MLISALLFLLAAEATAQPRCDQSVARAAIGSADEDFLRVSELTGKAPVYPEIFRRGSDPDEVVFCTGGRAPHPSELPQRPEPEALSFRILPLEWRSYLNSGYPDDRNDGALWQGRGISTELLGGARARWKFFSAGFAPLVAWQENRNFFHPDMTMPGYSRFANPFNYGLIDLPLRFGPSSYWKFDWGQSFARIDLYNVAAGISTENMWWGPGVRNSILMTNSAPGFPHLFLGTSHPQDIYIGWLQTQIVWGRLHQSKWFMDDPSRSRRLYTALTLGYEPRFLPGFFLGLARVFIDRIPPGGLPAGDYFSRLFQSVGPSHNGVENQLASVFARWVFVESGLEIYGEWGKDDYWNDFRDLITQPEHAQAYVLGLHKVFAISTRHLRISAELTHTLEKPTNNPTRPVPIFYSHYDELQGYTNDGQMIGAGVGPQVDSQYFAADLFQEQQRIGIFIERVGRNDRYFYDQVSGFSREDAEIAGGARGLFSFRQFDFDWSIGYGHRYNLNFGPDAGSVKIMLAATFVPGR